MKVAVTRFPGTNNEKDVKKALESFNGIQADIVPSFTKEGFEQYDAVAIAGGFSYGDYLRPGAIASISPIIKLIKDRLKDPQFKVLGICNGFQILTETKLLPGVLLPNSHPKFICKWINVRGTASKAATLHLPIAHFEGNYFIDENGLRKLKDNDQIALQYVSKTGAVVPEANPNGSIENIAGIYDQNRQVLGMMPHPERASFSYLGSTDGRIILKHFLEL